MKLVRCIYKGVEFWYALNGRGHLENWSQTRMSAEPGCDVSFDMINRGEWNTMELKEVPAKIIRDGIWLESENKTKMRKLDEAFA